jgi:pSer/pThr/pTyr-binding forkhead associated (FHA) protein
MAASLIPLDGGSPIALDKPIMLIGRNQDCDITLQTSSKVSRRHCCVAQCGNRFLLRDLGSMNGVRVNTHRVVEFELQHGDEVAIADVTFTFQTEGVVTQDAVRGRQKRQPVKAPPATPAPDDEPDYPVKVPSVSASEKESDPYVDNEAGDGDEPLESDSQSEAGFVHA